MDRCCRSGLSNLHAHIQVNTLLRSKGIKGIEEVSLMRLNESVMVKVIVGCWIFGCLDEEM